MTNATNRKPLLSAHLLRKVAVEAPADPRSICKLLRGEPLALMTAERIQRALEARGLAHLVPDASGTPTAAR